MESILEILKQLKPEEDFCLSKNFIEDGLLDSFDVVNLVSTLDNTFNISIDGTDIIEDNLKNADAIKYLLKKYNINI